MFNSDLIGNQINGQFKNVADANHTFHLWNAAADVLSRSQMKSVNGQMPWARNGPTSAAVAAGAWPAVRPTHAKQGVADGFGSSPKRGALRTAKRLVPLDHVAGDSCRRGDRSLNQRDGAALTEVCSSIQGAASARSRKHSFPRACTG